MAFLPNARKSLKPKKHRHPDKKLTNTSFTCKYWDILAKPYDLLEESSNTKSKDSEAAGQGGLKNASNSEDEGHDLSAPSPDQLEDQYLEEGEAEGLCNEEIFVDDD